MTKRKSSDSIHADPRLAGINRILSGAIDETNGPPLFVNQVQIIAGPDEIIFDFYRAGPNRGNVSNKPEIAYVQRIIMVPKVAARFAKIFSDLLEQAETPDPEPTENPV